MQIYNFWFSPVYHTREMALCLGKSLDSSISASGLVENDLTDYDSSPSISCFGKDDVAIFAAPVYAGRIPAVFLKKIESFKGNETPAVLLVSYGNRAYDNALRELGDFVASRGFIPVAGAACVARHTIARIYAEGRPNKQDIAEIESFAKKISGLIEGRKKLRPAEFPGESCLKESKSFPLPQSVNSNCVHCGICQDKCPVRAIDMTNPAIADLQKCICCMRCVALCPEDARVPDAAFIGNIEQKLHPLCKDAKQNEFFLIDPAN